MESSNEQRLAQLEDLLRFQARSDPRAIEKIYRQAEAASKMLRARRSRDDVAAELRVQTVPTLTDGGDYQSISSKVRKLMETRARALLDAYLVDDAIELAQLPGEINESMVCEFLKGKVGVVSE